MVTGATGLVVDHALFGGEPLASDVLTPAVRNSLDFLEQLALAPINLGQFITSGSLLAAHSSINVGRNYRVHDNEILIAHSRYCR